MLTHDDDEEISIHFSDLKRIFLLHKEKIQKAALITASLTAFFLLFSQPTYQAHSSFRSSPNIGGEQQIDIKNLVKNALLPTQEDFALSILQSDALLTSVVQKMGLQATVNKKNLFFSLLLNSWENAVAGLGGALRDLDLFALRDVNVKEEKPQHFYLLFSSPESFQVLNRKKEVLAAGKLHQKVSFKNTSFTLEKTPARLKLEKRYSLTFEPMAKVLKQLKKHLEIRPSKMDRNLLTLSFLDRNRHFAADFLNQLMYGYQDFLKKENEEIVAAQIAYLQKRQRELTDSFEEQLNEHVCYLQKNLKESGFISTEEELKILAVPKEEYASRLFAIDLELKRLETIHQPQDRVAIAAWEEKECTKLATEEKEVKTLLTQLENEEPLSEDLTFLQNPRSLAKILAQQFNTYQKNVTAQENKEAAIGELKESKQLCKTYLTGILEEIENKKNTLKENKEFKSCARSDIPVISLESLQELYQHAQEDLGKAYAQIREFISVREQMERPDFELSSLTRVLGNSSLNGLLTKTLDLSLELSDSTNRSEREIERIKETIATQKKIFGQHIDQSIELYKVQAKVLEEKIASLQKTAIDFLTLEKGLIQQKLKDLSQKMNTVPEKWKLENKLDLEKELSLNIIQGISALVESKNMHQHLYHIDSKPLDVALPPISLKPSHTLLFSLIFGCASACALFAFHLFKALYRGLPVTYERLKKSETGFGGRLSSDCQVSLKELSSHDLETFRRVASFITEGSTSVCTSFIGGKNPNYSHSFAELLALKGLKVVLVECSFDGIVPLNDVPGLWHYLEGKVEVCPCKQKASYDFIPTGGTTRHAAEMVGKTPFSSLIENLKKQYDHVLIYSSALPFSSEAHTYMKYADKLIVSTYDEPLHELQTYTQWAKNENKDKLLFVHFG